MQLLKNAIAVLVAAFIWFCSSPADASNGEPSISNDEQDALETMTEDKSPKSTWQCGFIDKQGKPVIDAQYEGCKRFSEGLAPVRLNSKWGFIDPTGALKIPATFDNAEPFSNGRAAVRSKLRWGYVDTSGKLVTKPVFLTAKKFSEGLAFVERETNKWVCIDKSGAIQFSLEPNISRVDDFKEGLAVVHGSSSAVYCNKEGEKVMSGFGYHSLPFSEKLASVSVSKDDWNFLQGYADTTGKVVIQPKYIRAGSFHEGLACVCIREGEPEMLPTFPFGKWGFISNDGKVVIPPTYEDAGNFHEGLAQVLVGKEGRCGYINRKGELQIPAKYIRAFDFSDSMALVRDGVKWKYLNAVGATVLSSEADYCGNFHEGLALVGYIQNKNATVQRMLTLPATSTAIPIHQGFDPED